MNRFKTKKGKKEDSAVLRPSLESESSFSLFRRGKKSQEQESKKEEIDLATALPSSDDFRTSLLMTGLSARFSMLREQDDPNSKIGKASDDSVLFPKRQSRMADLGFTGGAGLDDIAEVESVKLPYFARKDSYTSDDSGNIMNRAKPTEGNNLFGGRQKIYKIAANATSTKNVSDGGMSNRAVYGDDVAQSSFQRWRLAEKEQKERRSSDEDEKDERGTSDETRRTEDDSFVARPESPLPAGYNRKRETSSTTSSTPSGSRTSTAATSIISQPTAFAKDLQAHQMTGSPAVNSTPTVERSFTRTRRLYEQGLTQDLHDQQTSAVSRLDTLTRRPTGSRTPDLGANSPSPSASSFADRFAPERRPIMSKSSAPNLRSMSPPTTGSSFGTMDFGTKTSTVTDTKGAFLASPPLSPPISETGEHIHIPIQPKDVGKATAMGVFHKPADTYDDSKYAQRQLQLQQGRETPTLRFRDDSSATPTHASATSSAQRHEKPINESPSDSPLDSPIFNEHLRSSISPQVPLQRPSDQDHPAFRTSALPVPLGFNPNSGDESLPRSEQPDRLTLKTNELSTGDSPTLGPNTGLSGMVRQHLRSESDVSSIYGPTSGGLESRYPLDNRDSTLMPRNPWEDQDWNLFDGLEDERSPAKKTDFSSQRPNENENKTGEQKARDKAAGSITETLEDEEEDEFASQLANARRRVREKLTSYVEPDTLSPQLQADSARDLPPPSRSNPLGILKGKSSRGSLVERNRDPPQSKAMKMLGLGAATMTTVPSPIKQSSEETDRVPFAVTKDETNPIRDPQTDMDADTDTEERVQLEEEKNAHPGLRAFRNARRELQRRKELETLTKHQVPIGSPIEAPVSESPGSTPRVGVNGRQRAPSMERTAPPVSYQLRGPSEESHGGLPQPRSQSSAEVERSGPDHMEGQNPPRGRLPRLRNNSIPYEAQQRVPDMRSTSGPRMPGLRSPGQPGLPGTDIRRSPNMPPPGYPHNVPQSPIAMQKYQLDRSNSAGNLRLKSVRPGTESAGVSSPSPLFMEPHRTPVRINGNSGSAPPTPTIPPPRRTATVPSHPQFSTTTSTLNESLKRVVNKNDISEPTFLMSTSRVPTMSVEDARESRSRSGSIAADYGVPPPLPPVNPRRKRESSRTRTMFNGILGRKSDEVDAAAISMSTPHLPLADAPAASSSVRADVLEKPVLRKASSEAKMDVRASGPPMIPRRAERNPHVATGLPPAGRSVVISNMHKSPAPMQGGMF